MIVYHTLSDCYHTLVMTGMKTLLLHHFFIFAEKSEAPMTTLFSASSECLSVALRRSPYVTCNVNSLLIPDMCIFDTPYDTGVILRG